MAIQCDSLSVRRVGRFYFGSYISNIMEDQKDRDKAWQLCYKGNGWRVSELNGKGKAPRNKNTALDVRRFTMGKDRHFPCTSTAAIREWTVKDRRIHLDIRWNLAAIREWTYCTRQKNSPGCKMEPAHSGSCKAKELASKSVSMTPYSRRCGNRGIPSCWLLDMTDMAGAMAWGPLPAPTCKMSLL